MTLGLKQDRRKTMKKSENLTPGSRDWHLAMAEEIKNANPKDDHAIEISDFHKLIGENQMKLKDLEGK